MNTPWSKARSLTLLAGLGLAAGGPNLLSAAEHPDIVAKAEADMKAAHVPSPNFVAPGEQ